MIDMRDGIYQQKALDWEKEHEFPLNPTYHGLQLYLLIMGGVDSTPPCKMALSGCFWLKLTSDSKSR